VWHVDKSVEGNLTWNNAPKSTALLDVVTDLKLPEEGDDFPAYFSEETRKIGQGDTSKKCGSKMTFRISVPTWIKKGGVEFRQELSPFGGWMLQYNC
jgi:hypothetical protein